MTAQDKRYHEQLTTNAPKDAATRRGEKIARFKREKEMKTQIEVTVLHSILAEDHDHSLANSRFNRNHVTFFVFFLCLRSFTRSSELQTVDMRVS